MYQSSPDPASIYSKSLRLDIQPRLAYYIYRLIGKSYLGLPNPSPHFWGTALLDRFASAAVTTPIVSALCLLLGLLVLLERPRALAFYVMATGALGVFYYAAYLGYARHHGTMFMVFLAALWMGAEEGRVPWAGRAGGRAAAWVRSRILPGALLVLLAAQAAGAAIAVRYELALPFSQGGRAAAYIEANGLKGHPLVGDTPYAMSTVSAALGAPIYLPRLERWATYTPWIANAYRSMSLGWIVATAERLGRETGEDYLIILNYPLGRDSLTSRRLRPVAAFGGAIVGDENYYLYRKDRRTPR
jgi:hypothetical protein